MDYVIFYCISRTFYALLSLQQHHSWNKFSLWIIVYAGKAGRWCPHVLFYPHSRSPCNLIIKIQWLFIMRIFFFFIDNFPSFKKKSSQFSWGHFNRLLFAIEEFHKGINFISIRPHICSFFGVQLSNVCVCEWVSQSDYIVRYNIILLWTSLLLK